MRQQDLVDRPGGVRPTRVRWKIFFLMLMLVMVNYVDRASISVAMPIIQAEFHLSPTMQGLLLSSFFWTYGLMQIPGGLLADRFKPRIVITVATIAWGLFQALAAATTGYTTLLLTRIGLGAAEGPIYPAGAKLNGLWMPPAERGRGAALLDGGAPLGAAFGSIIVAALISAFHSWRISFLVAGLGTVAFGALAWRYIRNSPAEHPGTNALEIAHINAAQSSDAAAAPEDDIPTNREIFSNRSVWLTFIGWVCCNAVWTGLLTWMPNYLAQTQHLQIASLGGFTFIIFLAGFIGEVTGGVVLDTLIRRGVAANRAHRSVFGISAAIATAAMFTVAYMHTLAPVVVLLAVALFFTRWSNLYWVIPPLLAGKERCGMLGGCMNFCTGIWSSILPLFIGLIVQITGSYFDVLVYFAASGLVMMGCSLSIDYRRPKRAAQTRGPQDENFLPYTPS